MDGPSAGVAEPANEPGVVAASVYAGGRRIADIAIDEAGRGPSRTVMSSGSVCSNRARSCCNGCRPSSIFTRWPSRMPESHINIPSWSSTATRCSSWRGRPRSWTGRSLSARPTSSWDTATSSPCVTAPRRRTPPCGERCESCPTVLARGEDYILYAILDFIVDNYMPVVETVQAEVDELEDGVLHRTLQCARGRSSLLAPSRVAAPSQGGGSSRRCLPAGWSTPKRCRSTRDAAPVSGRQRPYSARAGRHRIRYARCWPSPSKRA